MDARAICDKYPMAQHALSSSKGSRNKEAQQEWDSCVQELRNNKVWPADAAQALGYRLQDGASLKEALALSSLPQDRLAKLMGVSAMTVSRWVAGTKEPHGPYRAFLSGMFPRTPLNTPAPPSVQDVLVGLLRDRGLLDEARARLAAAGLSDTL